MTQPKKNYTLPIIVMFFLFAMISFVTGFQNPFGVILKEQLSLSNLQSQFGNAANFIAYAFMGLPAGLVLQRKGYKFSAIAAVLVGMFGVLLMFISSMLDSKNLIFAIYLTGAFVAGFSMCMLNTVVNPMLNTLGGGGRTGNQLLQFGGATNSLAATICPVLVGYLMGCNLNGCSLTDARPALYIALGIFALAFVVLVFSKLPEPILDEIKNIGKDGKMQHKEPEISKAFKFRHFVMGIIAIFLYVGIEVGIPNFANLFMTSESVAIPAAVAGSLVGIYWLLMLVGRLIGGMIGGIVNSKTLLACVASLTMLFLLLAIVFDPSIKVLMPGMTSDLAFSMHNVPINVLFLILCGLFTSVMWGGIFNLAVEGLGKYTAIASGLFMVMVCGGGVLPLVQGIVADAAGYLSSYWVLLVSMTYILYYALFGSKVLFRDCDK